VAEAEVDVGVVTQTGSTMTSRIIGTRISDVERSSLRGRGFLG
jgi:hypothetical protein